MECKSLQRLPVVNEWQSVLCPRCRYYFAGQCANPKRNAASDPCPFDGKELPTEEVVEDAQEPLSD